MSIIYTEFLLFFFTLTPHSLSFLSTLLLLSNPKSHPHPSNSADRSSSSPIVLSFVVSFGSCSCSSPRRISFSQIHFRKCNLFSFSLYRHFIPCRKSELEVNFFNLSCPILLAYGFCY